MVFSSVFVVEHVMLISWRRKRERERDREGERDDDDELVALRLF